MISAQCNLQVKGHERLATSAASEADPRLTRRLVPSTSMPGVVAARMLARRNSSPITHCSTLSRHHSRLPLNIVQDSTLLFSDCSRPCQQLVSGDQRPLLLDTCAIAPPLRPAFFTLSTQQSQLDLTHCPKSVSSNIPLAANFSPLVSGQGNQPQITFHPLSSLCCSSQPIGDYWSLLCIGKRC